MSRLKSVAYYWHRYRNDIMPKDVSDVQREETRRAFYAGMWAMIETMERIGEPDVKEREAMRHIEEMKSDLSRWAAESINRQAEQN